MEILNNSERSPSSKFWLILLALLGFFSIRWLSLDWVSDGEGYESGNRRRFISVVRMECFLLLCSVFMYSQLMVYFDKNDREKYDKRLIAKERKRASTVLIFFMFASQMVYFLYFAPDVIQYISSTRFLVLKIEAIPYIGSLALDRKYQIKNILAITLVMSLLMWYGSDKIVVKHVTIPIKNFTGLNGTVKLALVSDIHAGASVHREQISKVVDKLLDLHVDAVALVGDMVDGPLETLAERMVPLWMLLYRYRTYFVSGNHEYYYGDALKWFNEYERHGIHVLNNRCDMFRNICIVGVNDVSSETSGIKEHNMNLTEAMHGCAEGSSRVVLAHNPASVLSFSASDLDKVDVILSGHTHAGQYYVLVPIVSWLLPYFHGLYDIGHGKLFVSAGTLYQGAPMKMLWMSEIWVVNMVEQKF